MSDRLAMLVDELCAVFADERHAIAALDHARIDELVAKKHALAGEVAKAADRSPQMRAFIERIRVEAQANALLAQTAADAIRCLLGYDSNGYDRRARPITSQIPRTIIAF